MNCPKCGSESLKINGSKTNKNGWVRRRRTCLDCGESFATFEIKEDELKRLQAGAHVPTVDEGSAVGSESLLKVMTGLNKKLNIIARKIAAAADADRKGIQKKSSKKTTKQGADEYKQKIQRDLYDIEDPDPDDIHAWAALIASLGD